MNDESEKPETTFEDTVRAVGALAAIVLPVSLVTGALLGAGYAVCRQMNR